MMNTEKARMEIHLLESFAKDVDWKIQNELMTNLILDYANIVKRLEELNEQLSHSQKMLMEAQLIAMVGRWDVYRRPLQIEWSGSVYEILELNPETIASEEAYMARVHPEDQGTIARVYRDMFKNFKPWTLRHRLVMEDDSIKWVYLQANPVTDQHGQIRHCYGTIQDITEMKKVEDELERHTEYLEELVEEKVKEISDSQMATIYALIKLAESRDDDTGKHIERTAEFCRLLAIKARDNRKLAPEITDKFIITIYKASPLHDIGKVGVPDSILLKPKNLTGEEFALMQSHVRIGYETLAKVGQQYSKNEFLKMGMDIALYHHEWWDGSGYLSGLKGEEIPLPARIMAISDVYDALRSKRTYKEALVHKSAVESILAERGSHFDPDLVDVFVKYHREFNALYDIWQ